MVTSVIGSQTPNLLANPTQNQATSSGSTSSFSDQLVAELEGFLSQSSGGSDLEIDITATQSQDSGARQFLVTVKDPSSASGGASGIVSSEATTPATPQVTAPVTASAHATSDGTTPAANPMAEQDAYWAAQPPAVQQLRNLPMGERSVMAQQLADQGYSIDMPIMVWGWDPTMTMQARAEYGYTWVPSMNQASVSSPGLAISNQIPYDPANPPVGSIAVNTDFADGLNA